MRKRISSLLLVTLISFPTLAQNIQGSYRPKADGEIRKQQVEYTVSEAMGENIVWDFSSMEQPDEDYTVKYTLAETGGNDSIIVGKEQQTRYYYRSDVDSVMLCGYETNLTKVQYDRPELLLKMPLTYGSRHDGLFHGTMSYCEKMFMRICGSYQVEVDGTGSMLLPNGDTLRHVSRVHIRTLTAKRHYPDISTEHELKTYTDSIEPYTDSNIRQVLMTDTLLTETNIYRWYAAGYRYPVMETSETISPESDQRQTTAYYCAPEEQTLMDDGEVEYLLA